MTYLFIDGHYLRKIHREAMVNFFGVDGDLELSVTMHDAGASRAYYYDAIDDAPKENETEEVRKKRVAPTDQFFAYVRKLRGFHVRPGSVRRAKKREQKEVDVSLAVDMMEHGFNGSMSEAVLIAGDLDFRPVVEALVRHGVFVHVWYHGSSVAQELPGAADFGREIRFRDLYSWSTESFKRNYRVPDEERRIADETRVGDGIFGEHVGSGKLDGLDVQMFERPGLDGQSRFFLWINIPYDDAILISDHDRALIERYAAVQYAPIQW